MKYVICSLLLAATTPTFASDAREKEQLLSEAKISLSEAIVKAQTRANGTAVSAEMDRRLGKAIFEVEVISGGRLFDVKLDAVDGSVIDVKEDLDK